MTNKKQLLMSLLVLIGAGVIVGLTLRPTNSTVRLAETIPGCAKLLFGTSSLEIRYPSKFYDMSNYESGHEGSIAIATMTPAYRSDSILEVREYIGTVEWAVSGADDPAPGKNPKYSTSTLNGYTAAFHEFDYPDGVLDDYIVVPKGAHEGYYVSYRFSHLSPEERELADAMLHSIRISPTTENLNLARVEKCIK
jgi:hypothetical protein